MARLFLASSGLQLWIRANEGRLIQNTSHSYFTYFQLFDYEIPDSQVIMSPTKKEFDGEYTFVVFPLVKPLKSNPVELGNKLGEHLKKNSDIITDFNVVKGFLNLSFSDAFWLDVLKEVAKEDHGQLASNGQKFMVEYASPNTNKPLHLGHIRNILLGWSMGQIAAE